MGGDYRKLYDVVRGVSPQLKSTGRCPRRLRKWRNCCKLRRCNGNAWPRKSNMKATEVDVLIIGAGPAGSTAAAFLQREGFRLRVVEKQVFPRFVIGESMLPSSMELLQEAGLLDAVESRRFMKKYGAVFLRGDERCNFDFADQFTSGWKYTYQVPRAEFDQALADAVAARGVEILYGHGVTAVSFAESHATRHPRTAGQDPPRRACAVRAGLQRLRPGAAAVARPGKARAVAGARIVVHPRHRRPAAAGPRGGQGLGVHASGRRVDLGHPVCRRPDQRGRGGRAGIFPAASRHAGGTTPAPS